MRLFAIGDTHLPSTRGKTMDRFGWTGHPAPLAEAWDRTVTNEDAIIVAGDISWATLRRLFEPYHSIAGFLQNNASTVGPYVVAGSRLWTTAEAPPMPGGEMGDEPSDAQLVEREARRLSLSLDDARRELQQTPGLTPVVAVHFPPLYANGKPTVFSELIEAFQPAVCVYGHLHGTEGFAAGFQGEHGGVRYVLASCDAAGFRPLLLLDGPRSAASTAGVAQHGGSPVG